MGVKMCVRYMGQQQKKSKGQIKKILADTPDL
jgi:hypothetical protein